MKSNLLNKFFQFILKVPLQILLNFPENCKLFFNKLKKSKKNKKYISNILFFYRKSQEDRMNIFYRINLAKNLENLNNNSNALYHLYIAHEIQNTNQLVLKLIVRNLLKMNDIYEAFKWSLKIKDINKDLFLSDEEYKLFFNDNYYSKFNKTFVYFGSQKVNYPMWCEVGEIKDFDKIDLKKSKLFFIDNQYENLFIDFLKMKKVRDIFCVISLKCLFEGKTETSKYLKKNITNNFFSKIIEDYIPFMDKKKKFYCYLNND